MLPNDLVRTVAEKRREDSVRDAFANSSDLKADQRCGSVDNDQDVGGREIWSKITNVALQSTQDDFRPCRNKSTMGF